jgi:hypothetical protein
VRRADNLHVSIILKYGVLNLLEPSELVQASTAIVVPVLTNLLQ